LYPTTFIAVRDSPNSAFHLAKVLQIDETRLSVHYLGTTSPTLDTAVFRLVLIAPDGRTVLKDTRPARKLTTPPSQVKSTRLTSLIS
jgi:hypothetical protein